MGKSSLFNRIVGRRKAIVEEKPGITLDRICEECSWQAKRFLLVDTGGLLFATKHPLEKEIVAQVDEAINEAEVIILLTSREVHPLDEMIAKKLRKTNKKVLLAVNKMDKPLVDPGMLADFYKLGLGEPYPISAIHGHGVAELLDETVKYLPESEHIPKTEKGIKVAVVGRANVGKSSYVNALLGKQRVIVMPQPGTTRDSVDTFFSYQGKEFTLIDTAGLRKTKDNVSYYSILRTTSSIKRADVTLLMIEAPEGFAKLDKKLFALARAKRCGIVIGVNKWDLMKDEEVLPYQYEQVVKESFPPIKFIPFVFFSALTGKWVLESLNKIIYVYEEKKRKVATSQLNELLFTLLREVSPPTKAGKQIKFFYGTQKTIDPPTFLLFMKNAKLLPSSYRSFIEKKIRSAFGFNGVPLKLVIKEKV